MLLLLLIQQCFTSSNASSSIAWPIPFYVQETKFLGIFTFKAIFFILCCIVIIALGLVHITKLDSTKRLILTGWGCFLLSNHLLSLRIIPNFLFIFIWVISVICGGFAAFLSLQQKYQQTFFDLGASYSLHYAIILLLKINNLILAIILFLVVFAIFFCIRFWNDFYHYAACKSAIIALTLMLLVDQFLPTMILVHMHKPGVVNAALGLVLLAAYIGGFLGSLILTIKYDEVKSKFKKEEPSE